MPNRLEVEIAKEAVKAALESGPGQSAIKTLAPLAEEGQKLLANSPAGRDLLDFGRKLAAEFPTVSTLIEHKQDPFSFAGKTSGQFTSWSETSVHKIDYNGWSNSVELKNGHASAVVVPQTGRIASFKLAGGENVFWQNEKLVGQKPGNGQDWMNFGGDKVWPAPQSKWPTIQKGDWPPPAEFDRKPVKIELHADGVSTTSDVNPEFGMRVIRRLTLRDSVMSVTNTFEKVEGKPVEVSVWSVAQLRDPKLLAFPLKKTPDFPDGFKVQMGTGIPSLKTQNDIASFIRDLDQEHKIGTPADTLVWIGEKSSLRMRAENLPTGRYPDEGSATEIYTNNKLPYIELETLGPLTKLSQGQRVSHQVRYQLFSNSDFSINH